jgi:hypothetical protein
MRARLGKYLLLAYVPAILAVTLYPMRYSDTSVVVTCLVCGIRGLADGLLNIGFFVPIGIGLALRGKRVVAVLLMAAVFSAGLELAQLFIPGRFANLGDIVYNTAGAVVGAVVGGYALVWLRPEPRAARLLAVAATVAVLIVHTGVGYLLQPSFPRSIYYGQWTPELGHLKWYRGQVSEFSIGPLSIPARRLANSDSVRALLRAASPVNARALAGPPTTGLGSLVSIYDDHQREIILLGPDSDAMVFRYRTRAAAMRFDQPDLRLERGMAAITEGDSLAVNVWKESSGHCISVNDVSTCGLGFTLGMGWSLLYFTGSLPGWLVAVLTGVWLIGLAMPGAFWARGHKVLALYSALLFLAIAVVPLATGLARTPTPEYFAVAAGIAAGMVLRRVTS